MVIDLSAKSIKKPTCHFFSLFSLVVKNSDRVTRWRDVTGGDIKILFAYNIVQGIVRKPSIALYWTRHQILATPYFQNYMSRNTFQLLMSYLHLNNDIANPKLGEPEHDPLAKVRPIVTALQVQFRNSYTPLKNLGLDEAGCKFHGRCIFRCFNPSKPDKYHIKLYSIAESDSGYTCGFEVYTGQEYIKKIQKRWDAPADSKLYFGDVHLHHVQGQDAITTLVMQMMHKYNFLDTGRVLYTDNYYTSVVLARELIARNTMLVGTTKDWRKGWPQAIKNAKAATKPTKKNPLAQTGLAKGSKEVCWRRSADGKLLAMCYADRKHVCLLSTIHKAEERNIVRKGSQTIWHPAVVDDYNKNMKAVDLADEQMRNYELHRRSLNWPRKLFFHLLNMAITNAYLLYVKAMRGESKHLCHLDFRAKVAADLIVEGIPTAAWTPPKLSGLVVPNEARFLERHFPEPVPVQEGKRRHRKCGLCKVKNTTMRCRDCQKFLCAWPCFKVFHTAGLTVVEEKQHYNTLVNTLKGPNQNATVDESFDE